MTDNKKIFTTPIVRKFARELGADVNQIQGTERKGRISQADVKKFISNKLNENNKKIIKNQNQFNHSDFGVVEVKEISRIKKIAAPHLANSWSNIPHVTHHDEADITDLEEFRSSLKDLNTG